MVYVWFEISFNCKNFAQRSSEVNSLVRFELSTHWLKFTLKEHLRWMRFSNYAIQLQQIQVTFSFKKQNVRQTTYRNNSLNGWRTNPERYPESSKQHSNSFQKTTRVLLSFSNCMIQSQQIQDVYASKSRMVDKIIAQWGPTRRIVKNTKKLSG